MQLEGARSPRKMQRTEGADAEQPTKRMHMDSLMADALMWERIGANVNGENAGG